MGPIPARRAAETGGIIAHTASKHRTAVFEDMDEAHALAVMALPTVASQLVSILYNLADTWFIGRTNNPQMIGATSLVLVLFLTLVAIANLFGASGGTLMPRQMEAGDLEKARKSTSYSIAMTAIATLAFSLLCLAFADPLLRLLGASSNTLGYARQYLMGAVVLGGIPTALSCVMPMILRNAGHAREAGLGVAIGGQANIALDPLFMFAIMPDGYQVMAASIATTLANLVSLAYFIYTYRRLEGTTILELPKRLERLGPSSWRSLFSVDILAALVLILFNSLNVVLNCLTASWGDTTLAVGIVMKLERLPQNVGLGICLGMVSLITNSFAKDDHRRMDRVNSLARTTILSVTLTSMALFLLFAEPIVHAFIDDAETVALGTMFLQRRALAFPFMLVGFQNVHYMLTFCRHLVLSIPAMILLNALFGLDGLAWSQTAADVVNAAISALT